MMDHTWKPPPESTRNRVVKGSLKVGDCVVHRGPGSTGRPVVREIRAVRDTGYDWVYLNGSGKVYVSENSSDPFFEVWWDHQCDNPKEKKREDIS